MSYVQKRKIFLQFIFNKLFNQKLRIYYSDKFVSKLLQNMQINSPRNPNNK
jgi:hypothetical protein